jgi:hypothetical protein
MVDTRRGRRNCWERSTSRGSLTENAPKDRGAARQAALVAAACDVLAQSLSAHVEQKRPSRRWPVREVATRKTRTCHPRTRSGR